MSKGLILLVEDHEQTANLISHLLEEADFEVEIVGTNAEADARLDSAPAPICVILDMLLANGPGTKLLNDFEIKHPNTVVPIIALTGWPITEAAVADAKVQALVRKPITDIHEFIKIVATVIADFVMAKIHQPVVRKLQKLREELAGARNSGMTV